MHCVSTKGGANVRAQNLPVCLNEDTGFASPCNVSLFFFWQQRTACSTYLRSKARAPPPSLSSDPTIFHLTLITSLALDPFISLTTPKESHKPTSHLLPILSVNYIDSQNTTHSPSTVDTAAMPKNKGKVCESHPPPPVATLPRTTSVLLAPFPRSPPLPLSLQPNDN